MEDKNNATSGKHQRSASNAPNDKRQKMTPPSCPAMTPLQNKGVLAAMEKLTELVEHHPQFHSKLEGMLADVFNALEPVVSAAIRKEKNEDSCPIFKLSNDELKHVFGYTGEKQYGFIACVSDRFRQVYLETFGGETLTSIKNAAVSPSRAELCLDMEGLNNNARAGPLFQAAASNGKLDILKWGEESGYELDNILDKDGIAVAALNGHLEVVKYLRKLGIPWNVGTYSNAAKNGHLELLKWCRANQCPWNEMTCSLAALNGHLELLKWCRANQCLWNELTCSHAASNGHLELLKWCRANQCPWNVVTCFNAALNGHLELLKWCRANQCPWNEETCDFAALNGHLELLKWCRAKQSPWNTDTCSLAALNGHLELLKWCRAIQCPWNERTCSYAAENGHLELLKWARLNGCPWDEKTYANR